MMEIKFDLTGLKQIIMDAFKDKGRKYFPHGGKFYTDIGDGSDKNKYDFAVICPDDSNNSCCIIKHNKSVIVFDGNRFAKNDISHPLNHKILENEDEAYKKMMHMMGKFLKKDSRGRYFTDTAHKDYNFANTDFDKAELLKVAKKVRSILDN